MGKAVQLVCPDEQAIAAYLGLNATAGLVFAQTTEQQAAPQQPASAEQSATPQPKLSPEQQTAAEKLGIPAVITNSIGMRLVLIPAGEFMMGSSESARIMFDFFWQRGDKGEWYGEVFGDLARFELEHPQHRVRITQPFYLGICEVTQEQYQNLAGAHFRRFNGLQNPVDTIAWGSAVEFCHRLSALPEEKSIGRIYRLPTEAECEYACRARCTTRYCFGDDPDALGDYAWFEANSSRSTHPVGEKRPNVCGLFDMHGNVWEWSVG